MKLGAVMSEWIKYLFARRGAWGSEVSWLTVIICRLKGHPHPVVWYNGSGYEPDMTCWNCGDDLG